MTENHRKRVWHKLYRYKDGHFLDWRMIGISMGCQRNSETFAMGRCREQVSRISGNNRQPLF